MSFFRNGNNMTPKQKRGLGIAAIAGLMGLAMFLVFGALQDNIVFFHSPSDVTDAKPGTPIRLGGLVKEGSVRIDGLNSVFTVTDGAADVEIRYSDALPSLFREGQGIVAEGRLENGVLIASNVLAKHDETYMPKEVADSLKEQGVWKGTTAN
jgi:cytochrome c-type biogenesis protein CcmE